MSKSVFVSHASADVELARAFVDFLVDGIGTPVDSVFCSSLPDFGIPTGANFIEYMRSQMDESLIVIMLMSPSYMTSHFCQAEMGAAWVKAKEVFPIIVPPTNFSDVSGVMLGKQAIKVDDDIRYNDLREKLARSVGFSPVKPVRWDQKRKQFLGRLPTILEGLPKPRSVTVTQHEELENKYDEALLDLEKKETQISRITAEIAELKALKDPTEVARISAQFVDTSTFDQFFKLARKAKAETSAIGSSVIRRIYLADRYDKPFDAGGWDSDEIDAAIRRNVLGKDHKPIHRHHQISKANDALDEMEQFISAHHEQLAEYRDEQNKPPLEPDNEDFWNEFLISRF